MRVSIPLDACTNWRNEASLRIPDPPYGYRLKFYWYSVDRLHGTAELLSATYEAKS